MDQVVSAKNSARWLDRMASTLSLECLMAQNLGKKWIKSLRILSLFGNPTGRPFTKLTIALKVQMPKDNEGHIPLCLVAKWKWKMALF